MGMDDSHSTKVAAARTESRQKKRDVPSDLASRLKEHGDKINRVLVLMSIIGNIERSQEGSFVKVIYHPRPIVVHEGVLEEMLMVEKLINSAYPETSFKRDKQDGIEAVSCEAREFDALCKQFGVSERPLGFRAISSQHPRHPEEPHTGAKR